MKRKDLTDMQWERLQPLLPPQKPRTGRPNLDHRRLVNGILWLLRTGAPWRDVPDHYGPWRTVASRFYAGAEPASGNASLRPSNSKPMPMASWTGRFIMLM